MHLPAYFASFLPIFAISLGLSLALTPLAGITARGLKCLDYPDERKIHTKPIPLLGGAAIYFAFAIAVIANMTFSWELKGIALGATFIIMLGTADDLWGLSASTRLIGQVLAACILLIYGVRISFVPHWPGEIILESIITVVWVVGIANAFNFLDGVDGLASGLGVINSLVFFAIAFFTQQGFLGFLSIGLAGACLGFLPYNFKPARIFLGDGGSTFIGFTLAGLAIMGGWATNNPMIALSIPLLVLAIPIFDIIYITISRIHYGKVKTFKQWIDYVGKDHFHHRLLGLGFSERQTVFFIYLLSASLGISAIVLGRAGTREAILVLIQSMAILLLVAALMIVGRRNIQR